MAFSGQAATQALQRVHRSRSIGLSAAHCSSKAPSQPARPVMRPPSTGKRRACAPPALPGPWVNSVTSSTSDTSAAACSAASSAPMMSSRPALLNVTVGTGAGSGRWAAASNAAILGLALPASRLQPPVSRMFTKRMGESAPSVCCPRSANSRCSCVQATTTGSPLWMARWNAPASRRHRVEWRVRFSCSASPSAFALRGIVWLQSQISVVMWFLAGRQGRFAGVRTHGRHRRAG